MPAGWQHRNRLPTAYNRWPEGFPERGVSTKPISYPRLSLQSCTSRAWRFVAASFCTKWLPKNPQVPTTASPTFPLLPFLMVYGIANGMELRIDKAGRIVVPKPLRERLGFKPDTELVAIEQPDGVLLKRIEQRPSMVKVDGLWVHQGSAEPGADWERILEDVREERIESVLKA